MPNIDIFKDIVEAVKKTSTPTTQAYDTPATVTRIEGDVAWVHIPGGVDETPVRLTIAAKAGDTVQLRVGGGTAWLVGNQSAPPTDDTTAIEAKKEAVKAGKTATDFVTDTNNGLFVHPRDNMADGVRIKKVIEILRGGKSVAEYGDTVRIGKEDSGHTDIGPDGMKVYGGDGTQRLIYIGYGKVYNSAGELVNAPFFEFGERAEGAEAGDCSVNIGADNEAAGMCCLVLGEVNQAEESAYCSYVGGANSKASAPWTFAHGVGLLANFARMAVFGRYNAPNEQLFVVGNGSDNTHRKNAFQIDQDGNVGIQGALYSSSNDQLVTKMFKRTPIASVTSQSVNAGGTARVEINVADNDYTPMAIAGILLGNSNFSYYAATLLGTTAVIYIKNNGSSAATTSINLVVFYIASSAL